MSSLSDALMPSTALSDQVDSPAYQLAKQQSEINNSAQAYRGWQSAGLSEESNALATNALKAGIAGKPGLRAALLEQKAQKDAEAAAWAPTVQRFKDINGIGDAVDWASGTVGSGARSTAPSILGSVGGLALSALTRGRVSPTLLAGIGGTAGGYNMEADEAAGEALNDKAIMARNTDQQILDAARVKGGINAVSEAALPLALGHGAKAAVIGARQALLPTVAKGIGAGMLAEGPVEAAQSLVGQATQNYLRGDPLDKLDYMKALEEGVGGALTGGFIGMHTGTAGFVGNRILGTGKAVNDTVSDPNGLIDTAAAKAGEYAAKGANKLEEWAKGPIGDPDRHAFMNPSVTPDVSDEQLSTSHKAAADAYAAKVMGNQQEHSAEEVAMASDYLTGHKDSVAYREQVRQHDDGSRQARIDKALADTLTKKAGIAEDDTKFSKIGSPDPVATPRGAPKDQGVGGAQQTKRDAARADIGSITAVADIWRKQGVDEKLLKATNGIATSEQKRAAVGLVGLLAKGMNSFDSEAVEALASRYGENAPKLFRKAYDLAAGEGLISRKETEKASAKVEDSLLKAHLSNTAVLDAVVSNLRSTVKEKYKSAPGGLLQQVEGIVPELRRIATHGASAKEEGVLLGLFGSKENIAAALSKFPEPKPTAAMHQVESGKSRVGEDYGSDGLSYEEKQDNQTEITPTSRHSYEQYKGQPFFDMRDEYHAQAVKDRSTKQSDDHVKRTTRAVSKQEYLTEKAQEAAHAKLLNKDVADLTDAERAAALEKPLHHATSARIERELLAEHYPERSKLRAAPPETASAEAKREYAQEARRHEAINKRLLERINNRFKALKVTEEETARLGTEFTDEDLKKLEIKKVGTGAQSIGHEIVSTGKLFLKKEGRKAEYITSAPMIIARMFSIRDMSSEDIGETGGTAQYRYNMLMQGLSALMETGQFNGKVGYVEKPGGSIQWLDAYQQLPGNLPLDGKRKHTVADALKQADEQRRKGDKGALYTVEYAETEPEKIRAVKALLDRWIKGGEVVAKGTVGAHQALKGEQRAEVESLLADGDNNAAYELLKAGAEDQNDKPRVTRRELYPSEKNSRLMELANDRGNELTSRERQILFMANKAFKAGEKEPLLTLYDKYFPASTTVHEEKERGGKNLVPSEVNTDEAVQDTSRREDSETMVGKDSKFVRTPENEGGYHTVGTSRTGKADSGPLATKEVVRAVKPVTATGIEALDRVETARGWAVAQLRKGVPALVSKLDGMTARQATALKFAFFGNELSGTVPTLKTVSTRNERGELMQKPGEFEEAGEHTTTWKQGGLVELSADKLATLFGVSKDQGKVLQSRIKNVSTVVKAKIASIQTTRVSNARVDRGREGTGELSAMVETGGGTSPEGRSDAGGREAGVATRDSWRGSTSQSGVEAGGQGIDDGHISTTSTIRRTADKTSADDAGRSGQSPTVGGREVHLEGGTSNSTGVTSRTDMGAREKSGETSSVAGSSRESAPGTRGSARGIAGNSDTDNSNGDPRGMVGRESNNRADGTGIGEHPNGQKLTSETSGIGTGEREQAGVVERGTQTKPVLTTPASQLQAYIDQYGSKNVPWANAARKALATGDESKMVGPLNAAKKQFGELAGLSEQDLLRYDAEKQSDKANEQVEGPLIGALVDKAKPPAFARVKEFGKANGADFIFAPLGVEGSFASRLGAAAKSAGVLIDPNGREDIRGKIVYVSIPGASRGFAGMQQFIADVRKLLARGAYIRTDNQQNSGSQHNAPGEGALRQALVFGNYVLEEKGQYDQWYQNLPKNQSAKPASLLNRSEVTPATAVTKAASGGKNDTHPNYVIYDDSRIETNYVHFNSQQSTPDHQASRDDVKKAYKAVMDTVGESVKVEFVKEFMGGHSGEWSKGDTHNLIRISLTSDVLGTAHHETMHELFSMLAKHGDKQVRALLTRVATNPMVMRQVERQLNDHPAALEDLKNNPEEAVAYLYQFWRAGQVKLGPEVTSFFQRVKMALKAVWDGVFGNKNNAELDAIQAEAILAAFSQGAVTDKASQGAVIAALNQNLEAHNKQMENVGEAYNQLAQKAGKYVFSAEAMMEATNNPFMVKVARLFNARTNEAAGGQQAFFDALAQQRAKWTNKLNAILDGAEPADLELARQALSTGKQAHAPSVKKIVDAIHAYNNELFEYISSRKVSRLEDGTWKPIEYRQNYFQRVWDAEVIGNDVEGFKSKLLEHHMKELKAIAENANAEIASGKGAGKLTASDTQLRSEAPQTVTPEMVADAVIARLLHSGGQVDLEETTSNIGMTPMAAAVNRRTLTWIDDALFDDYKSKDLVNIMSSYTRSMVKRAEYTRSFGNGGEKLRTLTNSAVLSELGGDDLISKATAELPKAITAWKKHRAATLAGGGTFDVPEPTLRSVGQELHREAVGNEKFEADLLKAVGKLEQGMKAVMAMEGTLGADINPHLRTASAAAITYQNFRLLSMSLFASFQDPMGAIMQGGEMKDAWSVFQRGINEVVKTWTNKHETDSLGKLAMDIGAVEAHTNLDAMGEASSNVLMTGKLKRMNDWLFKWNGLEAFTRGARIAATGVAVSYLERMQKAREAGNLTGEDTRRLEHLGLKGEIKLNADGTLDTNDMVNQAAIVRWVNMAVARPNAAHRTIWMSDPHYAIFGHLKQFTYTFHRTTLLHAANEAKLGNYRPAMVLAAGYVPVMIAADALKEMLIPGDEPPWMKMGLAGALSHGVSRANVFGVPQMHYESFGNGFTSEFGPMVDQVLKAPFNSASEDVLGALPGGNLLRRLAPVDKAAA